MTATASANPDAAEPQIIDDRYRVLNILGVGNSGTTYLAEPKQGGPQVALKALSLRGSQDWKTLELFEREVEILKTLDHPSIPRYIESFVVETETDRHFYLAQTLAQGKNLADWVESGWRCTEAEVEDIAKQLLDILGYLQSLEPAVIHRDLKPQNIIRSEDGSVALVDFGAVGHTYHNTFMRGSTVVGTFGYMAPEQFRAQAYPATDLYSLGGTLVFLLTRRSPAELPMNQLKLDFRSKLNLSPAFADWLEQLLEPELEQRFATAQQARKALRNRTVRRIISQPMKSSLKYPLMLFGLLSALSLGFVIRYPYRFLPLLADGKPVESVLLSGQVSSNEFVRGGGAKSGTSKHAVALFTAAIADGNRALAEEMLYDGFLIGQRNSSGEAAIHHFARSGDVEAIQMLVSLDPRGEVANEWTRQHETALALAKDEETAISLLHAGAIPKAHSSKDSADFFDLALSQNWDKALDLCIQKISLDPLDGYGTPSGERLGSRLLVKSIQEGNLSIANACVESGCQLNLSDLKEVSLKSALDLKQNNILSVVPDLGWKGKDRKTLLHFAVQDMNLDLIKALLEKEKSTTPHLEHRQYVSIKTLIPYVTGKYTYSDAQIERIDQVRSQNIFWLLVEAGANLNETLNGETALHLSIQHAESEQEEAFLEEILRKGADPNIGDAKGNTPLHIAKSIAHVELLLAAGANVNALNQYEKTPLQTLQDELARSRFKLERGQASPEQVRDLETAISLLKSYGAKSNVTD